MKKIIVLASFLAVMFMLPSMASATVSNTGTLTVTATVDSTITLVFDSVPTTGVALSAEGSSTATLGFGTLSVYGSSNAHATVNDTGTFSTSNTLLSSPFYVKVMKSNIASTSFSLTAQLNAADTDSNVWKIGTVTVPSDAASAALLTAGSYDTDVSYTLNLTVPFSNVNSINNSITFTALAL